MQFVLSFHDFTISIFFNILYNFYIFNDLYSFCNLYNFCNFCNLQHIYSFRHDFTISIFFYQFIQFRYFFINLYKSWSFIWFCDNYLRRFVFHFWLLHFFFLRFDFFSQSFVRRKILMKFNYCLFVYLQLEFDSRESVAVYDSRVDAVIRKCIRPSHVIHLALHKQVFCT